MRIGHCHSNRHGSSHSIPGTSALDRVLGALEAAKCAPRPLGAGWRSTCPAHDDRTPSLSVSRGKEGRVLLRCWAGCETLAVLQALGLSWSDLFEGRS